MNELAAVYRIDPDDFNHGPADFDHPSMIHGIGHVYRVMYHCLRLGVILNLQEEARLAFFAAFVHDLSRKHDGRCTEHGEWAENEKLPLYSPLFTRHGVGETEMEHIKFAIVNHSLPDELPVTHPSWKVTAILKDADALDRIRLGEYDLDPRYLRFKETIDRIVVAKELYYETFDQPLTRFSQFLSLGI